MAKLRRLLNLAGLIRATTSTQEKERSGVAHHEAVRSRLRKNISVTQWLNFQHTVFGARRHKYRIERRLIEKNVGFLFDEDFYRRNNPDIAAYKGSALTHFIKFGWREQRDPHPLFDIAYYIGQFPRYPANVNPLVHFHLVGKRRRVSPTRWFSYDTYRTRNADVTASKMEAFEHFARYGIHENRISCDSFDAAGYVARYPDVKRARMPALYHYIRFGIDEGRVGLVRGGIGSIAGDRADTRPGGYDPRAERKQALRSIMAMNPRGNVADAAVDVIIPVYRDYYLTLACIRNALKMKNRTAFEVVVVDDCSPEPALSEALCRIADKGLITLIRHDTNAGFVKSVNDGMRLHDRRDVILLNSDAEVYGNWIDRLRATAYAEPDIATVSPLTNAGTICSYPDFCRDNAIPADITIKEMDAVVARANKASYVPAPTGVGFCMYIRRDAIDEVGLFDEESFGTGYGEENDFCLRAQDWGWKDVIAVDTFVHHLGSASFLGEKTERVANALRIINQRYPGYDATIRDYVRSDPVRPYRAELDEARLKRLAGKRNMLIVSHTRGGGTEQHVHERAARHAAQGWSVFRLHADPANRRLVRFAHMSVANLPNMRTFDLSEEHEAGELAAMLKTLGITEMEIHHLGDFWARAPLNFRKLAQDAGIAYRFVVHDYMAICPRINLADRHGMYCGEPDAAGCAACLKRDGSDYGEPAIGTWRERYRKLFEDAEAVVVPNSDVSRRLNRYFPELAITVEPHDAVTQAPPPARERAPDGRLRIGTIGAISRIKGLEVLRGCARHARRKNLPVDFVVIGYTSNDLESIRAGLEVTGPYANSRVQEEIEKANLDAIFLPSLVPETYSYTLSIAFKTGLPIIAFDIGAVQERLREQPSEERCLLLPISSARSPEIVLRQLRLHLKQAARRTQVWAQNSLSKRQSGEK